MCDLGVSMCKLSTKECRIPSLSSPTTSTTMSARQVSECSHSHHSKSIRNVESSSGSRNVNVTPRTPETSVRFPIRPDVLRPQVCPIPMQHPKCSQLREKVVELYEIISQNDIPVLKLTGETYTRHLTGRWSCCKCHYCC